MNEMPYRHVPTPAEWEPDALVTALQHALAAGDVPTACLHAGDIAARTGTPPSDTDARVAIEHLVRAIAANRRTLLPLRASAPELGRAVKKPWRTHGFTVEPAASPQRSSRNSGTSTSCSRPAGCTPRPWSA